jgi:hypothetical protein
VQWEVQGSFENTAGPDEQVSISIINLMAVINEDGKGVSEVHSQATFESL